MNTPDPATPELELASAYLDGDVTAAERARVEASPQLLVQVAALRGAATAIADVPSPSAKAREAAIGSAMAEFDSLGQVVSLDSRRRWPNTLLTAAAAVVLLGVVGASVFNRDGNDNSRSTSQERDTKVADANPEDASGAVPTFAGDEVLAASAAPIDINSLEELAALPEPPSSETTPVANTTADTTSAGGADDGDRSFNIAALACMTDDQVFLADIFYQGTLAIAVRDTVTGVTEAIDDTCTVLARVNL